MLKRFKISGNARENDIFACMIHNLFDEYRFFSKYPEKELRITAPACKQHYPGYCLAIRFGGIAKTSYPVSVHT
eukprot:721466-Ditylum_brightwellii.AAC.1